MNLQRNVLLHNRIMTYNIQKASTMKLQEQMEMTTDWFTRVYIQQLDLWYHVCRITTYTN